LFHVQSLAETSLNIFETRYKADPAYFNGYRLGLRESISGLLASPHTGRPPSGNAMDKKNKAWSMPIAEWEWLESQPNQSETLRRAIAFYRQSQG